MATRVLSAIQYCDVPRPQLQWLIPSYIPLPGLVLLIGEPKAGKSFLALQVALHVSSGIPFLEQPVVAQPVLYLQFDTSETIWRLRLKDLRTGGIVLPDQLFFVHPDDQPTRVNVLSQASQDLIAGAIQNSNARLIIIDVLREAHNADEQDSTAMKTIGDILMTLCHGRTLMIVHHTHKLYETYGTPNPVNAARGSSYLPGKADTIWLLHNNVLAINSRFHLDERRSCERLPSGLWKIH